MSLELPGSYEKGHLMYHTVKQVLICFLNISSIPETLRPGQANKIIGHIHDPKINK